MKREEMDERIDDLARRARLDSWNSYVEEVKVPSEFAPALITGRTELLRLAQPRDLTAEEVGWMYKLLATLIETNMALQEHASQLALLVGEWEKQESAGVRMAARLRRFAEFKHGEDVGDARQA